MIVIGCGKRKLDVAAPARELYTGSLLVAVRKYAEASGQRWAILSAKHGFVLPETVLEPYEARKLRVGPMREWGYRIALDCCNARIRWSVPPEEPVECLAGEAYAEPFRVSLEGMGVLTTEPLGGLGLGHRLCWLSQALEVKRRRV